MLAQDKSAKADAVLGRGPKKCKPRRGDAKQRVQKTRSAFQPASAGERKINHNRLFRDSLSRPVSPALAPPYLISPNRSSSGAEASSRN